jgi:hypothetical protein
VPHSTWHNSNVDEEFPGGAKFLVFPRFMQGTSYQLKTNNFRKVLEIIG